MTLPIYVVCRSAEVATGWERKIMHYEDVELNIITGSTSYYEVLNTVISKNSRPALVIHDDVWLSVDIAIHVSTLIDDLDTNYPNWAICGNAGMRWDGTLSGRHVSDLHGGPVPCAGPRPVVSVDGNVMLLNCRVMRDHGLSSIPDLGGFHGYDLVLSLEALRHHLCVLLDPRLYARHDSPGNPDAFADFAAGEAISNYLSSRYMDYRFDTINGPIVLDNRAFYPFLEVDDSENASDHVRLLDCYDTAIQEARKEALPRLAICIRSQFKRPALLDRLLMSAENAVAEARSLIDVELLLITDQPRERAVALHAAYAQKYPTLDIRLHCHVVRSGRASRVDLAVKAFDVTKADFIWFIDDDDYLLSNGIVSVARSVHRNLAHLFLVDCLRVSEVWDMREGFEILVKSVPLGVHSGSKVYGAFEGENHLPFCSVIFPRKALQEKLQHATAHMAYYEDYFLLLVALSASRVHIEEIGQPCCGISIRGADNTVTETDRTIWNMSLATVLGEVLAKPELAAGIAWDAARRAKAPVAADLAQSAVIDESLGELVENRVSFARPRDLQIKDYGVICGWVDYMELDNDELLVNGWAADRDAGDAVEQIAIVSGRSVICLARPHLARPDVARALGLPAGIQCGFRLRAKAIAGLSLEDTPDVYGVSRGCGTKLRQASHGASKLTAFIGSRSSDYNENTFDETFYVRRHEDVRGAIRRGKFRSGFAHFIRHGIDEQRVARFTCGQIPSAEQLLRLRERYAHLRRRHPLAVFRRIAARFGGIGATLPS